MHKHTQGPWVIQDNDAGLPASDIRIQARAGDPHVAVYPAIHHTAEEVEANARLIAASPAMFDALEDIANYVNGAGHTDAEIIEKFRRHARAALALALGKEVD